MIVKIYDRDFEYTTDEVVEAQYQLNAIVSGITKKRSRAFGRFELPLAVDLTAGQKTTFTNWVAENHPDWEVVYR